MLLPRACLSGSYSRARSPRSRQLQRALIGRVDWDTDDSLASLASEADITNNLNSRRTLSTIAQASKSEIRLPNQLSVPSWGPIGIGQDLIPSLQLQLQHPSIHVIPSRHISFSSISEQISSAAEPITSQLPPTPDFVTNATMWGATGILLTNFHTYLHLPYWACISLTNICIRSAMIPIAIRGAKTSVQFGRISPEVQYLITCFTSDMKQLKAKSAYLKEGSVMANAYSMGQMQLMKTTLQTLRGLFRLNKVNLLDVFKSPTLQIPVFMYFAADLRKIINGSDPALAQQLVESSFFWITDLTEPDPWYGLPIATGALLYLNVETAMGQKTLGGETSSKSNMAKFLKDAFQTLAIFMPCFMAQQPSGIQLYLATSMVFTLLQSNAMRNDTVRQAIGLPPTNTKPKEMMEGEYVKDFLEKMAARQEAASKGGFVLGEGVMIGMGAAMPRMGKKTKSTIVVEKVEEMDESKMIKVEIEMPSYTLKTGPVVTPEIFKVTPTPFLPGMKEPEYYTPLGTSQEQPLSMPEIPLSTMEAANRGEKPVEIAPKEMLAKRVQNKKNNSGPINVSKLKSKLYRNKGKRGKR